MGSFSFSLIPRRYEGRRVGGLYVSHAGMGFATDLVRTCNGVALELRVKS